MAKNARRVQRGMWITSERRVRRIVPSPLVPTQSVPATPDHSSLRVAHRDPVCASQVGARSVSGELVRCVAGVSAWRCSPHLAERRGAAVDQPVAALRTAVADRVAERPNERSSGRRFHRGSTAAASRSDTRPSMRVRRLAVSDTGRGRRLSVEAVPMPPRGPWRACFTTSRCAVETASPQACDMGVPK